MIREFYKIRKDAEDRVQQLNEANPYCYARKYKGHRHWVVEWKQKEVDNPQ